VERCLFIGVSLLPLFLPGTKAPGKRLDKERIGL